MIDGAPVNLCWSCGMALGRSGRYGVAFCSEECWRQGGCPEDQTILEIAMRRARSGEVAHIMAMVDEECFHKPHLAGPRIRNRLRGYMESRAHREGWHSVPNPDRGGGNATPKTPVE